MDIHRKPSERERMGDLEELNQYLTKSGCYCLNEESRHSYNNLFMGDHTLFLKSDADEQLLIQLSFQQTLYIRRLQLGLPSDGSCPNKIKLFANKLNLGFSDTSGSSFTSPFNVTLKICTDLPATQEFNLTQPENPTVVTLDLFPAKWQRIETCE